MATRTFALSPTFDTFARRALDPIQEVGRRLLDPDRWVYLSCCDWFPDGSSFPTNHAALLRTEPPSDCCSGPVKLD